MENSCPRCNEKLDVAEYRRKGIASCFYCEGIWLPGKNSAQVTGRTISEPLRQSIDRYTEPQYLSKRALLCPDCGNRSFVLIVAEGVELDLCPHCMGVYFDKGELEKLFPDFVLKSQADSRLAEKVVIDVVITLLSMHFGHC